MADEDEKPPPPPLPMDIIARIPTHISDPASLARAAASHKLWRGLIKDPAFLDGLRRRRRGFAPSLLLGFFYQECSEAPSSSHLRQRRHRRMAPRFVPTSDLFPRHLLSGSEEEGCDDAAAAAASSRRAPVSLASFFQDTVGNADFFRETLDTRTNFYEPVASQDGFLALRRRRRDPADGGDTLRVCNPLTAQLFRVPGRWDTPPQPQHYFLLIGDEVDAYFGDGRLAQSFRLVCVWIEGRKLVYEYYHPWTNRTSWQKPTSTPEVRAGLYLMPSHAAASSSSHGGGSIHWLCGSWETMAPTHVATLRQLGEEELLYVELPPEAKAGEAPPLLASSADGGVLLLLNGLQMSLWNHKGELGNDAPLDWVLSERIDMAGSLPTQQPAAKAKVRLEIFRGKSGAVVVWIEGEGLFLFCLGDRSMRKIDDENNVSRRHFLCPYEIDWLSGLAVANLVVDGSLDEARRRIHGRWNTLMANNAETFCHPPAAR